LSDWFVDGVQGALVPPDDRGLLYGDGLFETIAFHRGRSALWPLHMERLARGCAALDLPQPDPTLLARECAQLVGDALRAVVRLALTRGSGGKAYFPPAQPKVRRILLRRDWPADMDRRRHEGLTIVTASHRLVDALGGGLKHANRLAQVRIASEIARAGADEALVLDPEGRIVEGLASNLVVVRDGALIAPGPHPAAVAGVGLQWLRRRAQGALEERPMRADALRSDDAIWVINSVQGPCPVRRLDGRELPRDAVLRNWQTTWRNEIEA
jgi:4-amino-4-deoxychorismate lyase